MSSPNELILHLLEENKNLKKENTSLQKQLEDVSQQSHPLEESMILEWDDVSHKPKKVPVYKKVSKVYKRTVSIINKASNAYTAYSAVAKIGALLL